MVFAVNSNAQDDLQKGKTRLTEEITFQAVDFLSKLVKANKNYDTYYYLWSRSL